MCLELCAYVSTPEVIDVLVPALFDQTGAAGERTAAALSLASLLRDSSVEEGLRLTRVVDTRMSRADAEMLLMRGGKRAWPFHEDNDTALPLVAQVIVDELTPYARQSPEAEALDPRIGIPLFIQTIESSPQCDRTRCFRDLFSPLVGYGGFTGRTTCTIGTPDWPGVIESRPDALWRQWAAIGGDLRDLRRNAFSAKSNCWIPILEMARILQAESGPNAAAQFRGLRGQTVFPSRFNMSLRLGQQLISRLASRRSSSDKPAPRG
jgi:hypothetical protein